MATKWNSATIKPNFAKLKPKERNIIIVRKSRKNIKKQRIKK